MWNRKKTDVATGKPLPCRPFTPEVAKMGMQSFRGAGGLGAYVSHVSHDDDAKYLDEFEHSRLAHDTLSDSERRVERTLVAIATVLWVGVGVLVAVWLV